MNSNYIRRYLSCCTIYTVNIPVGQHLSCCVMHTITLSGGLHTIQCLVHSHHTRKYAILCSTGSTPEVSFSHYTEILISNMPCILALFQNPSVHHRFHKNIPQSPIPKPTWDFVQGNRSKLKLKHNAQPATIRA